MSRLQVAATHHEIARKVHHCAFAAGTHLVQQPDRHLRSIRSSDDDCVGEHRGSRHDHQFRSMQPKFGYPAVVGPGSLLPEAESRPGDRLAQLVEDNEPVGQFGRNRGSNCVDPPRDDQGHRDRHGKHNQGRTPAVEMIRSGSHLFPIAAAFVRPHPYWFGGSEC